MPGRRTSGGPTEIIRDDRESPPGRPQIEVVRPDPPSNDGRRDTGRSKSRSKKEPAKVARKAPEGVALPERGIYGARYKLNSKLGYPNRGHKRLTATDLLEQEITRTEEWIRELGNVQGMSFSVTYANNQGGSSKSNNATHVGSVLSDLTRKVVYAAPATSNTKTARAALVAGVDPSQTLEVTQFANMADEFGNFTRLDELVQRNAYGLRVIGNDTSKQVSIDSEFGVPSFLRMARVLEEHATIRIWDQGNDNVSRGQLGLEAARRSDVMLFPATISHTLSLYALSETLAAFLSDDTKADEFEDTVPELARFTTTIKAQNGIVVMNRLGKEHDADDFRVYYQSLDGLGRPIGDLGFRGDYLTIPEDPYLGDPSTLVCDLEAINRETYLAYLIEAYMILVKVGRQRSMRLPEPSSVLVNLWERRGLTPPNLRPSQVELLPKPASSY